MMKNDLRLLEKSLCATGLESNPPQSHGKCKLTYSCLALLLGINNLFAAGISDDSFVPVDDWDFHQYMRAQSKDLEEIIRVNEHVEAVKDKAREKRIADRTVTFLVGRTGAGKTRVHHLLNKRRLYAMCDSAVNEYTMQPFEGDLAEDEAKELEQLSWGDWISLKASAKAEKLSGRLSLKAAQVRSFFQQNESFAGNSRADEYRPDTNKAQLEGLTFDLPGISKYWIE